MISGKIFYSWMVYLFCVWFLCACLWAFPIFVTCVLDWVRCGSCIVLDLYKSFWNVIVFDLTSVLNFLYFLSFFLEPRDWFTELCTVNWWNKVMWPARLTSLSCGSKVQLKLENCSIFFLWALTFIIVKMRYFLCGKE